jgi:hypothetical protein
MIFLFTKQRQYYIIQLKILAYFFFENGTECVHM